MFTATNNLAFPLRTEELYFTDPDGILVQLQNVSYCGGAGVPGNVCPRG
jgi:hypothetical protein